MEDEDEKTSKEMVGIASSVSKKNYDRRRKIVGKPKGYSELKRKFQEREGETRKEISLRFPNPTFTPYL
ncbi:hypothetical protein Csa_014773 [Cucumis sativus]|uniref:Uncharacterized protein n=1 Tax=Cucumis sativus TaxID=3659 RepID=A0A0A0KVF3_CUCSA|nr:hypothetical protein Csa_014773 [Cucumis sativus]